MVVTRAQLAALLGAMSLVLSFAFAANARADAGTVDLIVRRDAGLSATERQDIRDDAGVEHERNMRLSDTEVVSVPADDAAAALADLQANPDVRFAIRDGKVSAAAVPSADTLFAKLWGLRNTGQTMYGGAGTLQSGTVDADMDVPEAWSLGATGAGVTVGVVDTGIQPDHPDLTGRIATNAGEIPANGIDDDGDGKVDDVDGWDFVQNDNVPQDGKGHGTHVSGTIAATNGNGIGVTGVAPDAKVYPLRVLDNTGSGTFSWAADAFDLAGDMGLRVVNASMGGTGNLDSLLKPIFDAHPNTLYVVAAGNNGQNLDNGATFAPCQVPSANVVCVAASDNRDAAAWFTNWGPSSVDLDAPGVDVYSTVPTSAYAAMDGTSMATPHVAGEAALVLSAHPSLSTAQLKAAILDSTETKPALVGVAGHGRANAQRALLSLVDTDSDGVNDMADNCPSVANAGQADADGDGTGNACDSTPRGHDNDGDGVPALDDNCPNIANVAQTDTDSDGTGDACDATPRGPDADGDGVPDLDDQCAHAAGPASNQGCPVDSDADGVTDNVDNCPNVANAGQADTDGDGTGDACDATPRGPDADGDGIPNMDDLCPAVVGGAAAGGCPAQASLPVTVAPAPVAPAPVAPVAAPVTATPPATPSPAPSAPPVLAAPSVKTSGRRVVVTQPGIPGAKLTVRVQRKVCNSGRCTWKTVATKAGAAGKAVTVSESFAAGSYRTTVTATGRTPKTKTFTVRSR